MAVYAGSASAIPMGVEWINAGLAGGTSRYSPTMEQVQLFGPLIIIGLGLVNALAQYFHARLSIGAALSTLRDLQNDMFSHLMALDFAQQREEVSGQIVSRFTNDTLVLRETLTRASNAVRDVLTLTGLCILMLWYDWVLFFVVAMIYPLIGVPVARIGKLLRRASAAAQSQAGDVTALISETVTGARMVKSYQLEPLERARAADAFEDRLRLLKKMAYARAMNEPLIFFAGSVALALVVAIVAMRISAGALSTAEFISFIIALLLLSQPARGLGTLHAVMQEGFGAFERMLSLIDAKPEITTKETATDMVPGPGAIRFEHVSFSYDNTTNAVEDVVLDIEAGSMVAFVGASGSGKSTLLNLLPRLYDPTLGRILIDGHDLSQTTLRSLRSRIALVSQDAIIFNMSALENIAFGKPSASRQDIIRAATDAAANEFISLLPNGYDTRLGEGGSNLSGGQRQRIALARAFLKDAPILLLDEATSALDAESEAKIQDALARLTKGRTTLVIAHRLSTVKEADLIAVMDNGRVVETGTHDDLLASGGVYAKQASLQLIS
ncbi:ATP-dependent lipid A-core flippase (Lipid A export ATP-binding/permease protein MsbA) [Durusdinium trenchii]|uniref:ATP-dependent lipid A-core flippase (Lipid A export ATP-binding/permease protein MsbA) n=1 Tax=Durusdinium trenchii TaxID=1381693 RepID=A0ABP0LMC5_9DINO